MAIHILAVGKTKQDFVKTGIDEYLKRLQGSMVLKIRELPDVSLKNLNPAEVMEQEAESIIRAIKPDDYLIALDSRGKAMTSEQFALFLEKTLKRNLCFCLGGVYGLDAKVLARADLVLSFSAFTFTHQMIRLLLLEQIYRALNILQGGSYHK